MRYDLDGGFWFLFVVAVVLFVFVLCVCVWGGVIMGV